MVNTPQTGKSSGTAAALLGWWHLALQHNWHIHYPLDALGLCNSQGFLHCSDGANLSWHHYQPTLPMNRSRVLRRSERMQNNISTRSLALQIQSPKKPRRTPSCWRCGQRNLRNNIPTQPMLGSGTPRDKTPPRHVLVTVEVSSRMVKTSSRETSPRTMNPNKLEGTDDQPLFRLSL